MRDRRISLVELRKPADSLIAEKLDLFTVERSNLKSDGAVDPDFKTFGLAWYQSDIHVGSDGHAEAVVKSILLDGIFGFDSDPLPGSVTGAILVPPTHTFHVGF